MKPTNRSVTVNGFLIASNNFEAFRTARSLACAMVGVAKLHPGAAHLQSFYRVLSGLTIENILGLLGNLPGSGGNVAAQGIGPCHRWSVSHALEPLLQVGGGIEILVLQFVKRNPAPTGHIGDGVFVVGDPLAVFEPVIQQTP